MGHCFGEAGRDSLNIAAAACQEAAHNVMAQASRLRENGDKFEKNVHTLYLRR
jgi:hypothetical protein